MKNVFLLFFVTLSLFSTAALAGPKQGGNGSGGGAGIVCRHDDGTVYEAHLYDLYETENDPDINIQIVRSNEAPEVQIENIVKRWTELETKFWSFSPTLGDLEDVSVLRRALALVERDWAFLKEGVTLPLNTDIVPRFLPADKRCRLESIALYDDVKSVLYVDKSAYMKLSPTDQAGLKVHEAIYKGRRVLENELTSPKSRLATARFFSREFSESYSQFSDIITPRCYSCDQRQSTAADEFETRQTRMQAFDTKELELILGNKKLVCETTSGSHRSYFIGNTNNNKSQNQLIAMNTDIDSDPAKYTNAYQLEVLQFKNQQGYRYLAFRELGWGNRLEFQVSIPLIGLDQSLGREDIYQGKIIEGAVETVNTYANDEAKPSSQDVKKVNCRFK